MASKKFIFPITTGRSGTVYLYRLLQQNVLDADSFHERTGFQSFGVHTPDASHFTLFNSVGNVQPVQQFWHRKFALDLKLNGSAYIEISHFLIKAGLIENLELLLNQGHDVHFIILKRDYFKILWSYLNRFDFFNTGFTWLFTLDYRYPNVILSSQSLAKYGMLGQALWYIYEMFTRAEYYRQLLAHEPRVHFHDCNLEEIVSLPGATSLLTALDVPHKAETLSLPGKMNETKQEFFDDKLKQQAHRLLTSTNFDPQILAQQFIESGQRLAHPRSKT